LQQHEQTAIHKENIMTPLRQTLLTQNLEESANSTFNMELCNVFLAANIPWHKLQNPAHALNLVAEKIRYQYEDVDNLISNVKKIFVKAPLRVEMYKEKLKEMPLPPQPILTRWGTWLQAAMFYSEHFDSIKEVSI
jgi:hypothetical protein